MMDRVELCIKHSLPLILIKYAYAILVVIISQVRCRERDLHVESHRQYLHAPG